MTEIPLSLNDRTSRPHRAAVLITAEDVPLAELAAVARGEKSIVVGLEAEERLAASRQVLARLVSEKRVVYGITTGFGPLADREVGPEYIAELQRNLVYHLASGVGDPLPWAEARCVLLARLISMCQGHSGASAELISCITAVLNSRYAPVIPEKGTVGASGDLTPLAHVALALMGEGSFMAEDGTQRSAPAVLEELGIAPYCLRNRDALALVNGTSCMTGLAALSAVEADAALDWAITLSVAHGEVYGARVEAWSPALGDVRPHPGQIMVMQRLHDAVREGQRFKRTAIAEARSDAEGPSRALPRAIQDPYTVRCVPQVLGAVADAILHHNTTVAVEVNATTDNPVLVADAPYALHGGNFFGQHVAFASDALANALIQMAVLSERQLAWLVDEKQNRGLLPPFLQGKDPGLQSGFMGAQVTASALVAEMRTQAIPASIQSIPTNGNNQDVVSMGTIGARKTRRILADLYRVFAIQALALAQAMDLLGCDDEGWSPTAKALHTFVRASSRRLENDRPLGPDIEIIARRLPLSQAAALAG